MSKTKAQLLKSTKNYQISRKTKAKREKCPYERLWHYDNFKCDAYEHGTKDVLKKLLYHYRVTRKLECSPDVIEHNKGYCNAVTEFIAVLEEMEK